MFRKDPPPTTLNDTSHGNTRTGLRAIVKPQPWHAVSIDAKPLSCAAARTIHKKRFLSKDAPTLPLSACTKGVRCPCTYKHHEDRRGRPRRGVKALPAAKDVQVERRVTRGRRKDD
jgi:hypothetical protein